MGSILQLEGSSPQKPFKYTPITTFLFFSGLVTQRSPFSPYDTRYNARYLGGRPDMLIDGLNVELSNIGTLQRRPGLSLFSIATLASAALSFYSFHQINSSTNPIQLIADTASTVYVVTPTSATSILAKANGASQTYFQGVGNTLYMGDTVEQKAWQGSGASRNWGIAIGSVNNATAPTGGTVATDNADNGRVWVNPNNVLTNDGNFAVMNVPPGGTGANSLNVTGFGFGIAATSTILGIQVEVEGQTTTPTNPLSIVLLKSGSPIGSIENAALPASNGFVTFGGSSDLWGATWTPSDINSATFGIQIKGIPAAAAPFGGTLNYQIDYIRITIYGFGGPSIAVSGSAGTFSAVTGYTYVFAYGNSNSGHVSNPTNPSASTGVFTNKLNVQVSLTASTDPQVNQIRVFRTKDGGTVLFELPNSPFPNTTANVTDNAPDNTLQLLNFFLASPTLSNSPPPSGLVKLAFHLGRVWGSVNNLVYYSGGPDTLLGSGSEAFPPANVFVFPSTVNRLVPISSGLLVFTTDDTYIILGTGISTFYSQLFEPGLGLLSWNAFDIQGSRMFMYTSDRQFVEVSASGVNEIGYAIGDQLQTNFDPSLVYVSSLVSGTSDRAVYIADGSSNWYRCNWNQPPEGGAAWSSKATITGGYSSVVSVETSPGVHQLLVGATNGQILTRNTSVFSDSGAPYSASATIGSIVLAQPGQISEVAHLTLELQRQGTIPSLSVLLDEISGTFDNLPSPIDDPPRLPPSTTLYSKRYHLSTASPGVSAYCRHLRIKISFAIEATKNEVLSLSLYGRLNYVE